MPTISQWLKPTPIGLYCEPGNFYIDPKRPVDYAVITHAHADHARAGHHHVLATPATHAIMHTRFGENYAKSMQQLEYQEAIYHQTVKLNLLPAGHILGSAQVVIEYNNQRAIVSGDYKRRYDPTCEPFIPMACDLFVTEATFGLPIFEHPPINEELTKLIHSLADFPDRCHLLGVYALGKAQRIIASLRQLGYTKTIYIHTALQKLCELYEGFQVKLDNIVLVNTIEKAALRGELVLAPPSSLNNNWHANLPDALLAMASGWMQIRARNRKQHIELPLIISDHADWNELNQTIDEIAPNEVWVTHGDEKALVYACQNRSIDAKPMSQLLNEF